ncbi:MAG: C4-dicarboxylate transporter DctM subunit [Thermoproteota archaeon]|jgi:C4-dicarboxylate transporter DctM subunit
MLSLGLVLLIILLILFGQPLFVIMGSIASYCYIFFGEETVKVVVEDIFYAADKEILLAIPLFILAGNIMTNGSIAKRLVRIATALTTPVPAGLAISGIMSCAIFAAISGSSPVTLIAVGSIMYPALLKEGYSKKLSMGLLCTGGTLGIIVPPSIPMIIFAIMAGVSVVDLFIAGVGPSIVLIGLLVCYSMMNSPKSVRKPFDFSEIKEAFKEGTFALLMPLVILGGIYSGFFTATESAAIAVLYAFVVEVFIHREMKLKDIPKVNIDAAEMLGTLFLILILAVSLNKFMTYEQIPQMLVDTMSSLISNKITFLIGVNILLLIVGCMMDIMSAILVLAPILTPMAVHYGVNPVHFGIIMIVNLEIGYITPPVGINLFVASGIFKETLGDVIKSIIPLIGVLIIGLLIITFVPAVSLFLVGK